MKKNQILISYGDNPAQMVEAILNEIKPDKNLSCDAKIGLKPNLVVGKPANTGATTHPEIAEGIIRYFHARGFKNLTILESSWVGEQTTRAFKICGFEELAERYHLSLVDLKKDSVTRIQSKGLTLQVCSSILEVDYLINLPVLKAHCQTALTCALKNLKGCIPDSEKRRFHTMGLHQPIAHLSAVIPVHLTIVDAICGDLTFEEGGNPVPMGRIIAGTDQALIDAFATSLLGLEVTDVPYISLAAELGVGDPSLSTAEIRELNPSAKISSSFQLSHKAQSLSRLIDERQACSACYGSLIHALYRLEEEGVLDRLKGEKIKIGQGFKETSGKGMGVGSCTRKLDSSLPGCPPSAREIKNFLRNSLV